VLPPSCASSPDFSVQSLASSPGNCNCILPSSSTLTLRLSLPIFIHAPQAGGSGGGLDPKINDAFCALLESGPKPTVAAIQVGLKLKGQGVGVSSLTHTYTHTHIHVHTYTHTHTHAHTYTTHTQTHTLTHNFTHTHHVHYHSHRAWPWVEALKWPWLVTHVYVCLAPAWAFLNCSWASFLALEAHSACHVWWGYRRLSR